MDQYLIDGTIADEFDQLSLLSALVTFIFYNSEGRPGHNAAYMDRVTALRKDMEKVYRTEAMRLCILNEVIEECNAFPWEECLVNGKRLLKTGGRSEYEPII